MSFSDVCKTELWQEDAPRRACCRRAMAQGLLFCAHVEDGVFSLSVAKEACGEQIAAFLEKQLRTRVACAFSRHVGRDYVGMTLFSRGMLSQLQRADMSDLSLVRSLGLDCEHCVRYFLRGVVIASASLTDPTKRYHMEFACRDATSARQLAELLGEITEPPKSIKRKTGIHLYYKNSGHMEDLFSYLQAHRTLFALMNAKIERDIRNEENRATNCVATNIQKAVRAASEQTAAIRRLKESGRWGTLPEALRTTGELRLNYEDATLSELAALHNPPITKSGLNHRLQKLMETSFDIET